MSRISWLGIGLVLVGIAMLLDRLGAAFFSWQLVLWAWISFFGAMKTIDGFGKKKSGRVFWGTFLFLFGVYEMLCNIDAVELRSYWMLPATLVIIGMSLLMMYINAPREWHLIIPAFVFLGTGAVMILTEFGYLYRYDVIEAIRKYWPVGLIIFGLSLAARRIFPHSKA